MKRFCCVHHVAKAKKPPDKTRLIKARPHYRRLVALSNHMQKAVQVNFLKGLTSFKKKIDPAEVYDAWLSRDWNGLMDTVPWDDLTTDMNDAFDSVGEVGGAATEFGIAALPPPIQDNLRFDTANPRLQRYINEQTGSLITQITEESRALVRTSIYRTFDNALTPRQVANQIIGEIGLYPRLQTALDNYRKGLVGEGFAESKVETMSAAYENRLLDYRAMTIARTETRMAMNYGQLSVWQEAKGQGLLPKESKKIWVVDGEPCPICLPMDGVPADVDGFWTLNTGDVVMVPTESHPNCMCDMVLDMTGSGDSDNSDEEES